MTTPQGKTLDEDSRVHQVLPVPFLRTVTFGGKTIAARNLALQNCSMSDVTRILSQIDAGDPSAAERLLPLVYEELRKLAAAKLAQEQPGQTLQATALVHEAYLRLVGGGQSLVNQPA